MADNSTLLLKSYICDLGLQPTQVYAPWPAVPVSKKAMTQGKRVS